MTRAAKQKLQRETTAAYAASQPLFDALRIGFIRIGEQKAHLSIARDIVQHLHVKLPDPDSKNDTSRHERYIDCAVKAWRSATAIYAHIFDALAKVTAADASEGRAERHGHAEFAKMARTAAKARIVAKKFVLYEDSGRADNEPSVGVVNEDVEENDSESSDAEDIASEEPKIDSAGSTSKNPEEKRKQRKRRDDDDGVPTDTTPTNPILLHLLGKGPAPETEQPKTPNDQPPEKIIRLSERVKYDNQGRKILWDRGAEKPNVPYGTLGATEKKAWKAEKRRQTREKKQVKRAAKTAEDARAKAAAAGNVEDTSKPVHLRDYLSFSGATEPEAAHNGAPNGVAGVEYENVSAEVEARLKAKEQAKEAKKKEKKRKRESAESVGASGTAEATNEKPSNKKVRLGEVDAEDAVKESSKKHQRDIDPAVDGEVPKKRKKSKETEPA